MLGAFDNALDLVESSSPRQGESINAQEVSISTCVKGLSEKGTFFKSFHHRK